MLISDSALASRNPYVFQVNSKHGSFTMAALNLTRRNPYVFQVNSKTGGAWARRKRAPLS